MMNEDGSRNIRAEIESVGHLPTFPETAAEVVRLVNNSAVSMREISKVIGKDPSLAAKVLKFVNSAFYGLHQSVSSLQLALVMLGMKEIRNIVIGLSVFKTFDGAELSGWFNKKKFWQHSVSTGQIARTLAMKLSITMDGEDFTAGLLHDIGKIAIDQIYEKEFTQAWQTSIKENIPLHEAEMKILTTTHAEVGGWMAEKWNLPSKLVSAIRYHHNPEEAEEHKLLVAIVNLANIFSGSEGAKFGTTFGEKSLEDTDSWQIILKERPELAKLNVERLTFELETEVIKSVEFLSVVGGNSQKAEV